jgi:hypothetical protein
VARVGRILPLPGRLGSQRERFMSNRRVALSVGLAGMLPFGLGCAIAWGLYNKFRSDPGTVPISFPVHQISH